MLNINYILESIWSSYPLTVQEIEENSKVIDWELLSCNTLVAWDAALISKYEEKWDWIHLSNNRSIKWSIGMIQQYKDRISWPHFIYNRIYNWSEKDILIMRSFFDSKFEAEINLADEAYSVNYIYEEFLNYQIDWTLSTFLTLYEYFETSYGPYKCYDETNFIEGYTYYSSFSLYELYHDTIEKILRKKWTLLLKEKNVDIESNIEFAFEWDYISKSDIFKIDLEFVERYSNKLNWKLLVENKNIKWTSDFLLRHKRLLSDDYWFMDKWGNISESYFATIKGKKKLDLWYYLSYNHADFWTEELALEIFEYLAIDGILKNSRVNRSPIILSKIAAISELG